MGKASSSKKVARAARAGGKTSARERPKLAYPLAVFVILVFGSLLVVYARTSRTDSASATTAPSSINKDHWHAAYGFYVCDKFLPPLPESPKDPQGIHTHGDGVLHIHPFSPTASGDKSRLKVFSTASDVKFLDDGWKMPDGTEYRSGFDCNGKPAKAVVYRWAPDDPSVPIEVFDKNFGDIKFRTDRDAYAFAIVPDGVEPPLPDSVAQLDKLTDTGGAPGGKTAPGGLPPGVSIPSGAGEPVPGGATPGAPGGVTPGAPGGVTPGAPGGVTPGAPGGATPGGVTPGAPSGATPGAPSAPPGATPGAPTPAPAPAPTP